MTRDDARQDGQHSDEHEDEIAAYPGYVPIRVVSRRTGVNSVTLRAWERRYGLLKPLRTPKGHRLYSEADLARVARIVEWINRGVSISRVRALIEREGGGLEEAMQDGTGNDWAHYAQRLHLATEFFDENALEATVNEALSLYPFVTVCERLLVPAATQEMRAGLARDAVPGATASRVFFEGWLRRKLAARLQADASARGAPVLISALPGPASPDLLALRTLAIGCAGLDLPVLLLEAVLGSEELIVAGEMRRPLAILLHGDAAQDAAAFTRLLCRLVDARLAPVAVAGAAARIHEKLIADCGALPLADEPLALAARRLPLPAGAGSEQSLAGAS